MEILSTLGTNWKKLDKILAGIVSALNLRTPRKGNGILLTESPSGTLISIDPQQVAASLAAGTGTGTGTASLPTSTTSGEAWQSIAVIDQSDCSTKYIWYWGTAASANQGSPPTTSPYSQ